jgi:hypothetical protein
MCKFRAVALMRAGELAGLQGRWDQARRLLADELQIAGHSDDQYQRSHGYAAALRAEADRVDATTRPDADKLVGTRETADRLIEQARPIAVAADALLPETAGWLATAEADYARVYGRDDAQTWAEVAEGWEHIGQPYPAAHARYRQAEALLRVRGDRGRAAAAAKGRSTGCRPARGSSPRG